MTAPAMSIYFGIATRKTPADPETKKYGGKEECLELPGLWSDVDIAGPAHKSKKPLPPTPEAALRIIDALAVAPSAVVDSGDGYQAWYALSEPIPAEDAGYLLEATKATYNRSARENGGYSVDDVFNVARIMRLPGSWNHKLPDVRPVDVVRGGWDPYDVGYLEDSLDAPDVREAAPARPQSSADPTSVAEIYRVLVPAWTLLEARGWKLRRTLDNGDRYYTRPLKRTGTSAWWHAEGNWVYIFTSSSDLEVRGYSAMDLYVALTYGAVTHQTRGKAAADIRRALGIPEPSPHADLLPPAPPEVAPERVEETPKTEITIEGPPILSEEFWSARPELEYIRQAARREMVAPDSLLGSVLARVSMLTDYRWLLPRNGSLNLFVGLVGPPGSGKGLSINAAERLVTGPTAIDYRTTTLPLGSGEGLVRAYFKSVAVPNPSGKGRPIREVVRAYEGLLVRVDEGQVIESLASRSGQTTSLTLRSAWMGEMVGGAYAEREGKVLDAGSYRMALVMGIQPEMAGHLFSADETNGGTPQRFLWFAVHDPNPRQPDELIDDPGQIRLAEMVRTDDRVALVTGERRWSIPIDLSIEWEIDQQRVSVLKGTVHVDPLDAHAMFLRLKVAALLGRLAGRASVDEEDWRLAAEILETSNRVRDWTRRRVATAEARTREIRDSYRATTAHHEQIGRKSADAVIVRVAKTMARRVERMMSSGEDVAVTASDLQRAIASWDRHLIHAALEYAIEQGWIAEDDFGYYVVGPEWKG
jgi:hypothetical protein